jgi:hypothetical protein
LKPAPTYPFGDIERTMHRVRSNPNNQGKIMRTMTKMLRALIALTIMAPFGASLAQNAAPPANTRMIVQVTQVKPGQAAAWRRLQQNEVLPALKRAGVTSRDVLETLFGDPNEFITLRPLDNFAEFDGQGLLQRVLGAQAGDALAAKLADLTVSTERYIITRQGAFAVALNGGPIRVTTTYRLQPGAGGGAAFADFLGADVLPVIQQAKTAGRIAGWGVSITNQGAEEQGLRLLTTYYPNLAALDAVVAAGGVPQATVGEAAAQTLNTKQARLVTAVRTVIRRRIAELSY